MALAPDLLKILACPLCHAPVTEADDRLTCSNKPCGLVYAIRDGIPVMLIEEADRPCPKCGEGRDWKDETLVCPGCAEAFSPSAGKD